MTNDQETTKSGGQGALANGPAERPVASPAEQTQEQSQSAPRKLTVIWEDEKLELNRRLEALENDLGFVTKAKLARRLNPELKL